MAQVNCGAKLSVFILGCLAVLVNANSERCSILGNDLTAEQNPKNITLMNYPQEIPRYRGCHWVIHSWYSPIKLVFHYFDLLPVDSIRFLDSSKNHRYIGDRIFVSPEFSGLNPPPSVIYSMSRYLIVHVRDSREFKNPARNYSGFSFQYSTFKPGSSCNISQSVLDENNNILLPDLEFVGHGSIIFPNQSSSISPSAVDCTWRMKAAQGYFIKLTFNALNLSIGNCDDFVEVYDDPFGTKLGKFCAGSKEIPRTMFSSGPFLAVRFKTENALKSWFSVRYSQEKQTCWNYREATPSTIVGLTSFGFPFWPKDHRSCEWSLAVPEGYIVKLWFRVFDCPANDDRVIIGDGERYGTTSSVIGSYCQQRRLTFNYNCKAPTTVYSLGSDMWVRINFKSGRGWTNDGVSMYFTAVRPGSSCSLTNSADLNSNIFLNNTSGGVISTPMNDAGMDAKFDWSFSCTWKIVAPPGHIVNLTFITFRFFQQDFRCSNQYVSIYNTPFGESSQYTAEIEKVCHKRNIHSSTFSSGRFLSVCFKPGAGISVQELGFVAKYSFIRQTSLGTCQKRSYFSDYTMKIKIKGKGGMIITPDFLLKDKSKLQTIDCTWTIEVPQGERVKVTIRSISLGYGDDCWKRYVLLGSGETVADDANVMAKFCPRSAKTLTALSSGRYLTLQFKLKCFSCYSYRGMMMTFQSENLNYVAASAKQCLQRNSFVENNNIFLTYPTGVITIPEKRENLQCTWKITASTGSTLKITFKPFEKQDNQRCSNGYMEIRDGAGYDTEPTKSLSCDGSTISPWYSNGSQVWIRTRNDKDYSSWEGFELCYEAVNNNGIPQNPCSVCNDYETNNNIVMNRTSGVIQSPNYPGKYPEHFKCTWLIYSPDNKNVLLRFLNFSLRETADCSDSVEFPPNKRLCGNSSISSPFLLSGSEIVITFTSKEKGNSSGFQAEFVLVDKEGSVEGSTSGLSKVAKVLVILTVLLVTLGIFLFLLWKLKRRSRSHHSCPGQAPSVTSASAYSSFPTHPPPEVEMVPIDQHDPPPSYSSLSTRSPPEPHHPSEADMPQYPPPGKSYPWQK